MALGPNTLDLPTLDLLVSRGPQQLLENQLALLAAKLDRTQSRTLTHDGKGRPLLCIRGSSPTRPQPYGLCDLRTRDAGGTPREVPLSPPHLTYLLQRIQSGQESGQCRAAYPGKAAAA